MCCPFASTSFTFRNPSCEWAACEWVVTVFDVQQKRMKYKREGWTVDQFVDKDDSEERKLESA